MIISILPQPTINNDLIQSYKKLSTLTIVTEDMDMSTGLETNNSK
jgi:hypothetical protein